MISRLEIPFQLLLIAIFIVGQFGCATFSGRPALPWSEAFVYETLHYRVNTNTSPEVAQDIGEFMEKGLSAYREVIGYDEEGPSKFLVNAYATKKEYERVAGELGFPKNITVGLYSPAHPAAIHIAYIRNQKRNVYAVLLHEGTHQFLNEAAGGPLSAPLWLNEGLATYMEGTVTEDNQIEIGRIDRERLVHLQRLIKEGKCPSLQYVLSRRYGEPFSAADYAVSWGIVYTLRHAPDNSNRQPDGRQRLLLYIEFCRQVSDVSGQSLSLFKQIIVGQDSSLEAWQKEWISFISQLDPAKI